MSDSETTNELTTSEQLKSANQDIIIDVISSTATSVAASTENGHHLTSNTATTTNGANADSAHEEEEDDDVEEVPSRDEIEEEEEDGEVNIVNPEETNNYYQKIIGSSSSSSSSDSSSNASDRSSHSGSSDDLPAAVVAEVTQVTSSLAAAAANEGEEEEEATLVVQPVISATPIEELVAAVAPPPPASAPVSASVAAAPVDSNRYEDVFPSLPTPPENFSNNNIWHQMNTAPVVRSSQQKRHLNTTQVFHVPVEERQYRGVSSSFGNETNKKCEDIANRLGVKVEISCSKDQSLHVVLSGAEERVLEAKRSIIHELQTTTSQQVRVPKEHHKFLIGTKGSVLKELQEKTCTTIQVPKSDSQSEMISVAGHKDGIEQAIHEIQIIVDEQSKTGFERMPIPKMYHPWIRGVNNETCNEIAQRTGAKINIPPPQIEKDEIAVSGEREKVDAACAEIKRIYQVKSKLNITKLAIQIAKSQHKLIIGQKGSTVQETFRDFDVYVQVPKLESSSETIFLFGEETKLGAALSHVCQKANSIVNIRIEAPSWLHRYLIGEKGSNISKITADYPNTHVEFEQDNRITLEGPPDEVEKVKERLEKIIDHFKASLACEEIQCDPKYYPQLVGKKYENIGRINKEYGVLVRVPQQEQSSSNGGNNNNSNNNTSSASNGHGTLVRIEGPPEAVQKAKIEFLEMVKKVENERSKDIIIEQKYHSNLIGKNGKNLNELRAKFNDIQIQIPNQEEKSDVVTLRGNKLDVEKCFKHLQQMIKEMQESAYQDELHIFKQFHKMLIGKQGAFIRKIREDTQTRIDVPSGDSDSDSILIVGRQENVLKARKLIEEKVKELLKIEEDYIDLPQQLHTALIGKGGAIIKQIRRECGGVIINFPPEQTQTPSDRITLKGPRDEIEKAKQELSKMAKQKNDMNYTEEITVKAEYHRFLVGKRGTSINSMRDKHNVRIILPTVSNAAATNADSNAAAAAADTITVMGKEENVKAVRQEIESIVKNLQEQITDEVHVDPKWHKNFTAKRAKLINTISNENCNVNISFPKQNTPSDSKVIIKGPRDAVDSAKKRITEIVYDLENHVTIECCIPQKHHVNLIGKKGARSSQLSDEFKVEIQFPAKSLTAANGTTNGSTDHLAMNGNINGGDDAKSVDIVLISGLKDDCEKAKQALLSLIPITEEAPFPQKYHKNLLENKAEILRDLGIKYDVQVNVPKKGQDSNFVSVLGTKENIDAAKEALEALLVDLELKNYAVEINEIKPELIPQLRGRNGTEAEKLEKKFKVRIDFSRKGEPDRIVIKGLKQHVTECEQFIRKKITDEQSKKVQEIQIDNRVHSRIIGQKGKSLAKLMEKYKVDVKFSGRQSDLVIVKGDSADQVEDACDELKNLEEEYLQDVIDKEAYTHPSSKSADNELKQNGGQSKGFVVKGAPWERQSQTSSATINENNHELKSNGQRTANFNPNEPAPDTSNMEDFPTIVSSAVADGQSQKMTWGPSRK